MPGREMQENPEEPNGVSEIAKKWIYYFDSCSGRDSSEFSSLT
jgi:hypothetical protein